MTTVLVVDDHPVVADGLVAGLERAGITVVGRASDLDGAVARATALRPDVILCDVMLGESPAGLDLPDRLQGTAAAAGAVVFLSSFDLPYFQARAVKAGAAGYLNKSAEPDAIVAAVRAAAQGMTTFSAAALRAAREHRPPSRRELQIIRMVETGASNGEIGSRLDISDKTVEAHLKNLFIRYEVSSRTQLVTLARRQGWLADGSDR